MQIIKKSNFILQCIGVAILLISLSSCSKRFYTSIGWQSKPVVADGKPAEWDVPLRFYDDKSKLQYTFTNDANNLYVCVRSTDYTETNKILRAGMQVWIDTSGKDDEHTGIMFPLMQQGGQSKRSGQSGQGSDYSGQNQQDPSSQAQAATEYKSRIKNQQQMQLRGFKAPIGGYTPIKNEYGIQAGMAVDSSGIFCYELVVPFATFYHSITAKDTIKHFSIELVVNALPARASSGGGGSHGGGGGGGMGGGMRGGGMGGGMGGGGGMHGGRGGGQNSGSSDENADKNSLWRGIKLSYQSN